MMPTAAILNILVMRSDGVPTRGVVVAVCLLSAGLQGMAVEDDQQKSMATLHTFEWESSDSVRLGFGPGWDAKYSHILMEVSGHVTAT
jgi:hypothetical protein